MSSALINGHIIVCVSLAAPAGSLSRKKPKNSQFQKNQTVTTMET